MTKAVPTRPFDDMEALAWLHSEHDGCVTASAAELGGRWGWNRMRTGRCFKAWQEAGHIRRNAEAIIVTKPVTQAVTEAVGATVMPGATAVGVDADGIGEVPSCQVMCRSSLETKSMIIPYRRLCP
jgi:hypothetical protein